MENNKIDNKIIVGEFVSGDETKKRVSPEEFTLRRLYRRDETYSTQNATYKKSAKYEERGSSLTIKLGVCTGVFLLLLGLKLADTKFTNTILDTVKSAANENIVEDDELLGKLKFVELPGLLDVFAPSDVMRTPVEYTVATQGDDYMLRFECESGATVTAARRGTVKAIGEDALYGNYVVLTHENDLESFYYGFSEISVEENQPINELDTLGTIAKSGIMSFCIKRAGAPVDPCDYLAVRKDA